MLLIDIITELRNIHYLLLNGLNKKMFSISVKEQKMI